MSYKYRTISTLYIKFKESSFAKELTVFVSFVLIILLLLMSLTSCTTNTNDGQVLRSIKNSIMINKVDSLEAGAVKEKSPKSEASNRPVKVVVFADKSGSLASGYFPKLTAPELQPIINYVKSVGGELFLGLVQNRSRSDLVSFRFLPYSVKPPRQKKGERAFDYQKRIVAHHNARQQRMTTQVNVDTLESVFLREATNILDYSSLEASDICGAIGLGHQLLTERDDELVNARKVIIVISDGYNTTVPCRWPSEFPDVDFIMVSRSGVGNNDLSRYNPINQSSFQGAIRITLN